MGSEYLRLWLWSLWKYMFVNNRAECGALIDGADGGGCDRQLVKIQVVKL